VKSTNCTAQLRQLLPRSSIIGRPSGSVDPADALLGYIAKDQIKQPNKLTPAIRGADN
jgi:hypothetical protein